MQKLRYGGIYTLPDMTRVVAYTNGAGGYVCYELADWERYYPDELTTRVSRGVAPFFFINTEGLIFRCQECTNWSVDRLTDTGRTARLY